MIVTSELEPQNSERNPDMYTSINLAFGVVHTVYRINLGTYY